MRNSAVITSILFVGWLSCWSVLSAADIAPKPIPIRPLSIVIEASIFASPTLNVERGRLWIEELESRLNAWQSGSWSIESRFVQSWTAPAELIALPRNSSHPGWEQPQADKTLRLLLEDAAGDLRVTVREWDRCSRTLGPPQSASILDRREVVNSLTEEVLRSVRPLVELTVIEGKRIEGNVQAGELTPQLNEDDNVRPGDLLIPFLRMLDRKREVRAIQPVPWTTLRVESVDRSLVRLEMISAFQMPFPASRRRIEVWALRERPLLAETDIMLYPRGRKQNPLAGARCELTPYPIRPDLAKSEILKFTTDRFGIVSVPVDATQPVRMLQVYSGDALLARVPLVPGLAPRLELEVPDDRTRLKVEGEVHLLDAEMLDIVATREVLCARIRAFTEQERWADVDALLKELDRLPTLEAMQGRIELLRVQGVFAAQQARDKVAQARIEKLCEQVGLSAKKYLDSTRTDDLKAFIAAERTRPMPEEVKKKP